MLSPVRWLGSLALFVALLAGCDGPARQGQEASNKEPAADAEAKATAPRSEAFLGRWQGNQDGMRISLEVTPKTITTAGAWGTLGPLQYTVFERRARRMELDVTIPGEGMGSMVLELSKDEGTLKWWEDPDEPPVKMRRVDKDETSEPHAGS